MFLLASPVETVCRSLDIESVKTLVHAFVTSQVDYCNSVLAPSPMTITDKLQWVLNSAARLITATGKLTVVCHSYCTTDVPQRVQYKLAVMVHRCLGRQAPSYLADYCSPITACRSPWFLVASICDPPVAVNSSFHASVAALSVLVLSPLRAQSFGILCLTV